jgi:hypothetical protein
MQGWEFHRFEAVRFTGLEFGVCNFQGKTRAALRKVFGIHGFRLTGAESLCRRVFAESFGEAKGETADWRLEERENAKVAGEADGEKRSPARLWETSETRWRACVVDWDVFLMSVDSSGSLSESSIRLNTPGLGFGVKTSGPRVEGLKLRVQD